MVRRRRRVNTCDGRFGVLKMATECLMYYALKLLAEVGNSWREFPQDLSMAACLIQLDSVHSIRQMKHLIEALS
jgi:hypothetical protein